MLLPAGVFITLISLLGHKEWRFIVYLVPLFNIAAARGSRYLCVTRSSISSFLTPNLHLCRATRRKSTLFGQLAFLLVMAILLANLAITALLTRASVTNYPGGEAMAALHHRHSSEPQRLSHGKHIAPLFGVSAYLSDCNDSQSASEQPRCPDRSLSFHATSRSAPLQCQPQLSLLA